MGMVNPEKCPPSGSGASRHVCTASHPYLKVASNTQIPHPRPSSKMSPNLLPLAIIAMLAMAAMSQMMDDPVKSSTADAPEPPGIPSDWMRDGVDIGPTLYTMAGATKPSAYDKFTKKLNKGTVVWRDVYTGFPQVCVCMPVVCMRAYGNSDVSPRIFQWIDWGRSRLQRRMQQQLGCTGA